jgi:hypothetical protein
LSSIKKILEQNLYIGTLIFLFLDWFLITFKVSKVNDVSSDSDLYYLEWEKKLIFTGIFWVIIDYISFYLFSKTLVRNNKLNHFSFNIKLQQINNRLFYVFSNKTDTISISQTYLYGLRSVWGHLRLWVLPAIIVVLFIYYSFFLRSLPFAKIVFGYIIAANLFYLLISGFVFFIKKYQYRLYTSSIQRF